MTRQLLGRVSCPTAHHTVRVPVIGISTAGVESKCAPDMVTVRDNRTSTPTCSVLSSSAFVSIPSAHLQAVRVQEPRSDSVDKIGGLAAADAHNCICCGLPACGIAHSMSPIHTCNAVSISLSSDDGVLLIQNVARPRRPSRRRCIIRLAM